MKKTVVEVLNTAAKIRQEVAGVVRDPGASTGHDCMSPVPSSTGRHWSLVNMARSVCGLSEQQTESLRNLLNMGGGPLAAFVRTDTTKYTHIQPGHSDYHRIADCGLPSGNWYDVKVTGSGTPLSPDLKRVLATSRKRRHLTGTQC